MNLKNNTIPDNIKTIHLIAICGTGMGALASMLNDLGYEVTGSDQNVYPPISTFLEEKQIKIFKGFKSENLNHNPDLVIIGNAISKDNAEVVQTNNMNLHYCSMPQALNEFVVKDKKIFLITGTHGKTTTSSLLAWILFKADLDPTFMIGGILKNFDSNYRLGNGNHIVIEGDEYDTAFFDKGPKFLHYDPLITSISSIEFDHADIYNDLDHVKSSFFKLVSKISSKNTIIAYDDDSNITQVLSNQNCKIKRYGKNNDSFWKIDNVSIDTSGDINRLEFEIFKENKFYYKFTTNMIGDHNLLNILSVIAMADEIDISPEIIAKGLETFSGIKRRQEIRGIKNNITVIDDFAHHPTAVLETVKAIKKFNPNKRLIAVFEPRTNSSMRKIFQDVYPKSFNYADIVCISKPTRLDKIPIDERFSSEKLTQDLNSKNISAYYFENVDNIIEFLVKKAKPNDVILIMSNGGFENIHERLLEAL